MVGTTKLKQKGVTSNMPIWGIVLLVLVGIVGAFCGCVAYFMHNQKKECEKLPISLGVINQVLPTKIPFLIQYAVLVSQKRTRASYYLSQFFIKPSGKGFKVGAKVPVSIYTMPAMKKGKKVQIAYIRQKQKGAA